MLARTSTLILKNYPTLVMELNKQEAPKEYENVIFLQGDPFEHCKDLLVKISNHTNNVFPLSDYRIHSCLFRLG